jgi:8-hydroxy-5-deazaflavin:NADPH oxidoreductase
MQIMKIGIVGAGNVATKLAALMAHAGHEVTVGARDASKVKTKTPYRVTSINRAISHGEIVILAIPYSACLDVLGPLVSELIGKIVIDATNPLKPDWSPLLLGEQNSAGEEIARLLPKSQVVKAFNTVFADIMQMDLFKRKSMSATAFICGDNAEAAKKVAQLARDIGLAPVLTGPLQNARYLEAMAHLNIAIAVGQGGGTNAAFLYDQVTK